MNKLDIPIISAMHRAASLDSPQEDTMKRRLAGVRMISSEMSAEFLLEVIRVYLGRQTKSKDFPENLVLAIQKSDTTFPVENNGTDLKVVACAIVYESLSNSAEIRNRNIAMGALWVLSFQEIDVVYPRIFDYSEDRFIDTSRKLRSVSEKDIELNYTHINDHLGLFREFAFDDSPDEHNPHGDPTITLSSQVGILGEEILAILKNQQAMINALSEESNVHWWLFRGVINQSGKHFSKVEDLVALPTITLDLLELVKLFPWANSIQSIITKAIDSTKKSKKKYSLADFVRSVPKDIRSRILEIGDGDATSGLCSIRQALALFHEDVDGSIWENLHKRTYGPVLKEEIDLSRIAYRLFCELSFSRLLESYGK